MEKIDLIKEIKELEKQIEKQKERVYIATKKYEEQKYLEDTEKEEKCKEIDKEINMIERKKEKDIKGKSLFGYVSIGSAISAICISLLLSWIFTNLWWVAYVWAGLSMLSYGVSMFMWSKKDKKVYYQRKLIKELTQKKEQINKFKSQKLHILDNEKFLESQILQELENDYYTLTKYVYNRKSIRIQKAEIYQAKSSNIDEELTK